MYKTKIVYLFGDQTVDVSPELNNVLSNAQGPIVNAFISKSLKVLRDAVDLLPYVHRCRVSRFSSFQEVISAKQSGTLHPALEQALACVCHLSSFIAYIERGRTYPTPEDTILVGLCTGAIAAAAISACRSLSELLPVASHAVRIAFWTGVHASTLGDNMYPYSPDTKRGHWSLLVPNLGYEEALALLEDFASRMWLSKSATPWISATAEHTVTISGSPDKLGALHRSKAFSGRTTGLLPLFAPYHASSIFGKHAADSILEQVGGSSLPDTETRIPCITASDEDSNADSTGVCPMRHALTSILRTPVRYERIAAAINIHLSWSQRVTIVSIGTKLGVAVRTNLLALGRVQHVDVKHTAASETTSDSVNGPKQAKIAIIGMSGRFPEADDCDEFWEILFKGLDVHKTVPPLRWSEKHVDPTGTGKNTSATPYGCWLRDPGMFDTKFFHMSPREAPQVDPYVLMPSPESAQRIALMTAYEAMEDAGFVPESSQSTQKDRVGIFYGVTSNDWMETNSAQNIDTYFIPGGNRAFIPGRINYYFKLSGPSYSVDTACSSSLSAMHLACNALWRGEVDTALAGGTNVLTNPDFTSGLDRGHFLSRTGNCKTFDDTADGYCRGEGVVTFVLKRLEDALADNDPVRAVILGAATNHSAEAESITRPHVGAQKDIFNTILHDSGVDPLQVSYIEMHGTGTQVGDAGEMQSVLETFSPSQKKRRSPDQTLHIGSAKANVGHGEAVSGATSLAKVLLMMKHDVIPPHCGIKTQLNQSFPQDLDVRQTFIAKKVVPWTREPTGPRRAFINNFSAAGGNTAMLIEDAPVRAEKKADSRTVYPICISAKSATALNKGLENFKDYVNGRAADLGHLADISYTTTARRSHHPHRALMVAASGPELTKSLQSAIDLNVGTSRPRTASKVVFAFTGQGFKYTGMAKEYYASFSSFRHDLEQYNQIAQSLGFPCFLPIITEPGMELADASPVQTQLALTCLQIALARLWIGWNITPDVCIGHSLGEYAALCVAGVLSVIDTIYLVGSRAQLFETRCTRDSHCMLAVRAAPEQIKGIISDETIEVACINGPTDTVLSGEQSKIQHVERLLRDHGIKSTLLKVPFAFHSAQVDPILEDFERLARGVVYREPIVEVLSPLKAGFENHFDAAYLRDHCRRTVDFAGALGRARGHPALQKGHLVLEIGPQPIVSGMFKSILGPITSTLSCLAKGQDPWRLMATTLQSFYQSGHTINWLEYNRDFQRNVVELPKYSWDLQHFWIDYVHDWSLRKGEPLPAVHPDPQLPSQDLEKSTTIHKATAYEFFKQTGQIIVESDIRRTDLYDVVRGHEVDGFPLCTPSVYADIALSVGKYVAKAHDIHLDSRVIVIKNMNITRALIAKSSGSQILRTTVEFDPNTNVATCKFESLSDDGSVHGEHATCSITFADKSEMEVDAANAETKINALRQAVVDDTAFQFNRSMVYKCIGALAKFDASYQGLLSVTMDSGSYEASSIIDCSKVSAEGSFNTHPAVIDGLSQVGGFVMNCNDQSDLNKEVYVNHGWGAFYMMEPLSATEEYKTHVKMAEAPGKLWKGDIVVLKGDKVVAMFRGIALQAVPRRLLKHVLSTDGSKASKERLLNDRSASVDPAQPARNEPRINGDVLTSSSGLTAKLMDIVSEESGIALDELGDDVPLDELGVDSLMSLLILSRIDEELDINVNAHEFGDMTTIREIKQYVAAAASSGPRTHPPGARRLSNTRRLSNVRRPSNARRSSIARPPPVLQTFQPALNQKEQYSPFPSFGTDSRFEPDQLDYFGHAEPASATWSAGIPESNGVGTRAIESDLLETYRPASLSDLPEVQEEILCDVLVTSTVVKTSSMGATSAVATSVVVQGALRTAEKILFLLPDGSGSAFSYIDIPNVGANLAIVGLNCPFRTNATVMRSSSLESIIQSYVDEIRRRQPHGPYHLGGWSSGGILAYCATQQLIGEGEDVSNLLIIDSPEPTGLAHLPQHFYDHCTATGVFGIKGSAAPPSWLMPHFRATIDLLHDYTAEPLPPGRAPQASILWAADCVFDGVDFDFMPDAQLSDTESEAVKFLTEKKVNLSSGNWACLFPGTEVSVTVAEGAHHFSMMHEKANMLANWIESTLFA